LTPFKDGRVQQRLTTQDGYELKLEILCPLGVFMFVILPLLPTTEIEVIEPVAVFAC
jgi:hypothetical protein